MKVAYHHEWGSIPLHGDTLGAYLGRVARRYPDREAGVSMSAGIAETRD